ncbi:neprilysin-21 [Rhipicephalus sanguineus]|nr:neprilysin-21 [Rhipicephalus sanguineus]
MTPGSADTLVTSFDTLSACLRRKDAASGISAADLHGLRGALESFRKEALTLVSDHRLDGVEHLSAMQLFFVLYAANACGELRFGGRHRVNALLRNVPQFAEAFKCGPGTPMNPEEKCS